MKKIIRFILLLIVCILVSMICYFAYTTFFSKDATVEDKTENKDWEQQELYGSWTGMDGSYLEIDENTIVLTTSEQTYQIPYSVDDTSDIKIKLKVNNPYEFFIYTKENAHVLSGFVEDENENYVIENEFVLNQDNVDLYGFESEYKKRYEQSMFASQIYSVEDAMKTLSFLGKTKSDLKIENKYIDSNGNFYSINMTSSLFGVSCRGVIYSEVDGNKDIENLIIDEVDLYSSDSYDSIYSQFKEMYSLKEEGQEAYAVSDEGSVLWSTFEDSKYTIHLTHGTETNYVMVQMKRK